MLMWILSGTGQVTLFRIESFFIMNTESKKEDLFMKTAFEWDRELYVNAVP